MQFYFQLQATLDEQDRILRRGIRMHWILLHPSLGTVPFPYLWKPFTHASRFTPFTEHHRGCGGGGDLVNTRAKCSKDTSTLHDFSCRDNNGVYPGGNEDCEWLTVGLSPQHVARTSVQVGCESGQCNYSSCLSSSSSEPFWIFHKNIEATSKQASQFMEVVL
jgi:hypothetical protein